MRHPETAIARQKKTGGSVPPPPDFVLSRYIALIFA